MNGVPGVENIEITLDDGIVSIEQTSWTGDQCLITFPIEYLRMFMEALASLAAE